MVYTYNERLYIRPFLVPWIPYGVYSRRLGGGSGSGNLTYVAGLADRMPNVPVDLEYCLVYEK